MSSRRKSGRAAAKVRYAEPVMDLDDGEDEVELDEETAAAKKKRINKELATERVSARKRENDDHDFGKQPKKSKSAKAKSKTFKDAGKLSGIFDLPTDLLALVFATLEPLDLLRLSLTNKMLHEFLCSKGASSIWIQSRMNLVIWVPKADVPSAPFGSDEEEESIERFEPLYIPSKPSNLSDSAYTRLLFAQECFECGTVKKRYFESLLMQIRLCYACMPSKIRNSIQITSSLEEELGKKKVDQSVFEIVPTNGVHYHIEAVKKAHASLLLQKKKLRKTEHASWFERKKAEIATLAAKADEIELYKEAFRKYGLDANRKRWREKYQLRNRRKEAIHERVLAEEWGNAEMWHAYSRHNGGHRLFGKQKEFTEEEWQTMKSTIQSDFQARKVFKEQFVDYDRQAPMRNWLVSQYRNAMPVFGGISQAKLGAGDILDLPAMKAFFADEDMAMAAYDSYVDEKYELWKSSLPQLVTQDHQRKLKILQHLCTMLHAETSAFPKPASILEALQKGEEEVKLGDQVEALMNALNDINAVFICPTCAFEQETTQVLAFPGVLTHTHFVTRPECRDYDAARSSRIRSWDTIQIPSPWQADMVTINDEIRYANKLLLDCCNRDAQAGGSSGAVLAVPKSMSDKHNFDKDHRFTCDHGTGCNMGYEIGFHRASGKTFRKWDAMLLHVISHYSRARSSEEALIKISAIEIAAPPPPPVPQPAPAYFGGASALLNYPSDEDIL